jgi:hypothetical protein
MINLLHSGVIKDRFFFLLVSLIFLILSFPLLDATVIGQMIFSFLLIIIPLSGVHAVSSDKKQLAIALSLAIPFIIINTINTLYSHSVLFYLNSLFAILFYSYTIVVILKAIIKSKKVNRDIIFGAIAVYLLIGITWAAIFSITESLSPNSFSSSIPDVDIYENVGQIDWSDYMYYSFTTLATVGYGDIIPISPYARLLSIFEAILGIFYIAILISILVGTFVSQSVGKEFKKDIEEEEEAIEKFIDKKESNKKIAKTSKR